MGGGSISEQQTQSHHCCLVKQLKVFPLPAAPRALIKYVAVDAVQCKIFNFLVALQYWEWSDPNKIQHFLKKQDEEMDRKTDISKMQCSRRKCITLFGFKSALHLLVFPCLHLLWYAQTHRRRQKHNGTNAQTHKRLKTSLCAEGWDRNKDPYVLDFGGVQSYN